MLRPLLLAALLGAAVDTVLTRLGLPHRLVGWELPAQALAGWVALALIMWPYAAVFARGLKTRLGSALVCTALPVALHATLRDAVRDPRQLTQPETFLAPGLAVLAAVLVVLLLRRLERGEPARIPGALALALLLGSAIAMSPLIGGDAGSAEPGSADGSPTMSAGADGEDRPNLLLLVWDTTRADALQPYGHDRETTPHLARLAERAVVYERAYSATVFTLSSHTSMLTGRNQSQHGTSMTRQTVDVDTIALQLRAAGYRTGAFVGTSVLRAGGGLERGFDVYDDAVDPPICDTHLWDLVHDLQVAAAGAVPALRGNGNPHWWEDHQRPAPDVLGRALDFVDDGPADQPWFVFINLFDVHWPYLPAADARALWVRDYDGPVDGFLFRSDAYPPGHQPTVADRRYVSDLYDAEMWTLDQDVDAFLGRLDLERTAVLMTSDHGEGLGEDGRDGQLWSHEHLHAPQTHVPMLLAVPGDERAGTREDTPVSGVDVGPTLLGAAGLAPPPGMAGLSLLAAPADERIVIVQDHDNFDEWEDGDAAIRGRFKLLETKGERTLHDLDADPLDLVDLSAEHPAEVEALGAAIDVMHGLAAEIGEDRGSMDMDALRALGYVGDPVHEPPPASDGDG